MGPPQQAARSTLPDMNVPLRGRYYEVKLARDKRQLRSQLQLLHQLCNRKAVMSGQSCPLFRFALESARCANALGTPQIPNANWQAHECAHNESGSDCAVEAKRMPDQAIYKRAKPSRCNNPEYCARTKEPNSGQKASDFDIFHSET
jgi:hypothetical protein